jgi:hypothetical protein
MKSPSAGPLGPSATHPLPQAAQLGSGHFMLTLCRLAAPVTIRPPQSPHLKPFTFFTSCAPQPDGSEHLYLHMGYFATLADAERWLEAIRDRYPHAIATVAPQPNHEASPAQHPDAAPGGAQNGGVRPRDPSLSDTQVLRILEARHAAAARNDCSAGDREEIAMLRPEDTSTRQALKEAVAQGAPVSFAVQLQWSSEPIDLGRLPSLPIFKVYPLYAVESRRDGRSRYFLRMGFFADPITAREIAAQVRATFAAAAIVPVGEHEVLCAREAGVGISIPCLVQERIDPAAESGGARPPAEPKPRSRASRGGETLEQTLKQLAERELWTDPDSLSETGVRHLKVEVQERTRGRS